MVNPYSSPAAPRKPVSYGRSCLYLFLSSWALLTVLAFTWTLIYPEIINRADPSPDSLKAVTKASEPLH